MKKLFRVGMALVVGAGFASWALPVTHAHASDVDVLVVSGVATITNDTLTSANVWFPQVPQVCGDLPDPLRAGSDVPSVDVVGGCGTFSFGSNICQGASSDDSVTVGCSVTATGDYANLVCGTGQADGTATGPESGQTESFSIVFVGGQGILFGSGSDGDTVVGAVQLSPNPATPPAVNPADGPLDCADSFQITSEVAAA